MRDVAARKSRTARGRTAISMIGSLVVSHMIRIGIGRVSASLLLSASVTALTLSFGGAFAAESSVSPDGNERYECGNERISHSGCFTHWVRQTMEDGEIGPWSVGWCPKEKSKGVLCWGGGVAWWYWNGDGEIGDPVLKDFWVRDYAGLDDPTKGQENSYGDAIKLPGPNNCYRAKTFTACMVPMKP